MKVSAAVVRVQYTTFYGAAGATISDEISEVMKTSIKRVEIKDMKRKVLKITDL